MASLINSGRVRLCGNFAGARIDLSASPAPRTGWNTSLLKHAALPASEFAPRTRDLADKDRRREHWMSAGATAVTVPHA